MHITGRHFPITEDLKLTKMMDIQLEWTYSHGTLLLALMVKLVISS